MNKQNFAKELENIYYFFYYKFIEEKITEYEWEQVKNCITDIQYYNNLYEKGKNT